MVDKKCTFPSNVIKVFFQAKKSLNYPKQGRISPTLQLEQRPWSCLDSGNHPPPLPPKKRNIKSYMEMFGRSIIPNGNNNSLNIDCILK
jgi:hypothetical protein